MVVAPVAEASVDLCAVASGLVCLPCPFLLSQLTRRRQQGGSAAGNKLLRTDGDLSSPVQWRNAQGQRAAVRSLVGSRTAAACCQLPHAKAKKARSEGKATSVAPLFCSGFFFASHNLTF